MSVQRCLLVTGSGRYSDPWHPFDETTEAVADALADAGYSVEITADPDAALAASPSPDLLAVNIGLPRDGGAVPSPEAGGGLIGYLESGRPLLGIHVSSTSFIDLPEWELALGGRWVRGVSMHPEQGEASILVRRHTVTEGIDDFVLYDERYSYLRVSPEVEVLAAHEHDGIEHPVAWLREADGRFGRAAYDGLGHDARSYDSESHRLLLRRMIDWLGATDR